MQEEKIAQERVLTYPRFVWQKIGGFFAAHMISAMGALLFLLYAIFVLWPIFAMMVRSVTGTEGLTLQYYREFFSHSYYYRALTNSLLLGLVVTPVNITIAFCIAYMTTRGPIYLRKPLRLIVLLPLIAPPFIFALSLIILFGRSGIITQAFNLNWSIYGFWGCAFAQTLSFLPLSYMMIESTLSSLDPNLEDSAANLGATEGKILRSITIPLLTPGFFKAILLCFVMTVSAFGNLVILMGRTPFLAPDVYLMITGQYNFNMASVLSFFLIVPCAVIFIAQNYLIKGRGYTTILGKPVAAEPRHITPAILIPMLAVSCVACGFILLAFGVVGVGSFLNVVGVDNTFTLKHILDPGSTIALISSIRISVLAGLFGGVVGVLLAYTITRGKFKGRATLEVMSLSGFAIPGAVFGIGYILAFNKPPLLLTGTMIILVIVSGFRHLVIGEEAGITKLQQLSIEIEEASQNLGASTLTTFRRIVLPIIFPAFMYGFMYVLMRTMIGLAAVIFLVSPGYPLAAIYIFDAATWGKMGLASATTLKVVIAEAVCLAIIQYLSKWTGLSVTRKRV